MNEMQSNADYKQEENAVFRTFSMYEAKKHWNMIEEMFVYKNVL